MFSGTIIAEATVYNGCVLLFFFQSSTISVCVRSFMKAVALSVIRWDGFYSFTK